MFTEQLKLYACVYLFAEVMAFSCMLTILQASRERFYMAKKYIERFTFYYYKTSSVDESLIQLQNSLGRRNGLRQLIRRARRRGDSGKALKYVDKRIGCMPVWVINELVRAIDGKEIPRAIVSSVNELKDHWEKEVTARRKAAVQDLCVFFLSKELLLAINFGFYYYFNNQECFYILVAIHGLGFLFLLLYAIDNRYKIKGEIGEGKLAFLVWAHLLMVLLKDNTVKNSIIKSYDLCSKNNRKYIKNIRQSLMEDDSAIPVISRNTAMVDVKKENSFLGVLFENLERSGENATLAISPKLKELYEEIHEGNLVMIKRKSKTFAGGLRNGYQLLGSLGIMLNIIQLLTESMGSFM